jgi:hypothetical protein
VRISQQLPPGESPPTDPGSPHRRGGWSASGTHHVWLPLFVV